MSQSPWLAAHIFYDADPERMLVEAIQPLIAEIMDTGLAERHFFMRYFEGGRHIRLRFQAPAEQLEHEIKPKILEHMAVWFAAHPTQRDYDKDDYFPNDSVQFIPYEPEIKRYGGPLAIKIAEQLFEYSSYAAMALISESKNWSYERALGAALQMHVGLMYGLGWNLEQAQGFCRQISRAWLGMVWYTGKQLDRETIEAAEKETLAAFEKAFAEQKEGLIQFISMMWNGLQEGADFDEPWLDAWVAGVGQIGAALDETAAKGELVYPERFTPVGKAPTHWEILESYVHMTNNRLGIQNKDEAYLGYLINQSFEELES